MNDSILYLFALAGLIRTAVAPAPPKRRPRAKPSRAALKRAATRGGIRIHDGDRITGNAARWG